MSPIPGMLTPLLALASVMGDPGPTSGDYSFGDFSGERIALDRSVFLPAETRQYGAFYPRSPGSRARHEWKMRRRTSGHGGRR